MRASHMGAYFNVEIALRFSNGCLAFSWCDSGVSILQRFFRQSFMDDFEDAMPIVTVVMEC